MSKMRITESEIECLNESLAEESYLDFAKRLRLDENKQNLARALDGNRGAINDKDA